MKLFRIALANIRFHATPDESIALAIQSIDQASAARDFSMKFLALGNSKRPTRASAWPGAAGGLAAGIIIRSLAIKVFLRSLTFSFLCVARHIFN
jgi:hypothetical protein